MAKRTFREESACGNRSRATDLHHNPGGRRRRAERHRLRPGNSFERSVDSVLRSNSFCLSYRSAFFWAAYREGLCWGGSACSLLSSHAGRNLSACSAVILAEARKPVSKTSPRRLLRRRDWPHVIEDTLIRLARSQRTDGAHCEIFIHAIVCGYRKNFTDIIATSLIILSHHEATDDVDEKRSR